MSIFSGTTRREGFETEIDHLGQERFTAASLREIRLANARRAGWTEIPAGEIDRSAGYIVDRRDGRLYSIVQVQVFDSAARVVLNEHIPAAFYVNDSGEPVLLQRPSEPPFTLEELGEVEGAHAAELEQRRERRRAEIESLPRGPFLLADLIGCRLPTLRRAAQLLDEYHALGLDKGEVALRLPLHHRKRDDLVAAARVVWSARELVAAHVAAKRPLGTLPDAQLLADGTVAP